MIEDIKIISILSSYRAINAIFMNRKFYLNISQSLLLLLLLFTGCKPALLGEFLLTNEEKETVPFKGTETMTYLYNDSIISLVCNYRKDTTWQGTGGVNTNDYYIWESDKTKFEGENFSIFYTLQSRWEWTSHDLFSLTWHDEENNLYANSHFILPLDTDYLDYSQGYLEQMTVQGKDYQSVFYDSLEVDTASPGQPKAIAIFYSKDAGLIRLDFQDGSSWQLKEIEWK
jgi:hypothetical protein